MPADPAIEAAARGARQAGMKHSLGLVASVAMRLDHSILAGPKFGESREKYLGRLLQTVAAAGYALAMDNLRAVEEARFLGFWHPSSDADYAAKLHEAVDRAYLAAQPAERTAREMRREVEHVPNALG